MVVFQIISSIDIGGAERVAINIARSRNKYIKYHIVEVIKSKSVFSDKIKKELNNAEIKFHTSPFRSNKLALLLFWSWFWILYLKYKPDVLHSHTEVPDLSLWIFRHISKLFFWIKPKYIRTIHNTQMWNKWKWVSKIVEPFYQHNNCNVAISESTRDCYHECYGGDIPPIIYNGISKIPQKKFEGLDNTKNNILFAGRLERQKGTDVMIKVFRYFSNNPHIHFYIIGAGSQSKRISEAFSGQSNVTIMDKVYGLNEYLGSFDYLFMPSQFEGLALMSIEASMAKTPTIISDCPGLRDTMPPNWPLKSKDNNPDDYIKIISNLEKHLKNTYGQIAYEYSNRHFAIDKMIDEYENIYIEDNNIDISYCLKP